MRDWLTTAAKRGWPLACRIAIIGWSLYLFVVELARAQGTMMTSDEGSSILASRAVFTTGFPTVPSGLIYWRSPLSHYLDGLSIAIVGDRPSGWRGASIVAMSLLCWACGEVIVRRGRPLLGVATAVLVGVTVPLLDVGISARMYMVYTLVATLTVIACVFFKPLAWNRRGWTYLALAIAAPLGHQHFILFIPGLFAVAIATCVLEHLPPRRLVTSPLLLAPIASLLVALGIHFGENFLWHAWTNASSSPSDMGAHGSFNFPAETIASSMPASPLAILSLGLLFTWLLKRRIAMNEEMASLALILLPAHVGLSLTLPHELIQYVLPLLPGFVLLLVSPSLPQGDAPEGPRRVFRLTAVAVVLLCAVVIQIRYAPPLLSVARSVAALRQRPSEAERAKWALLRAFAAGMQPRVLSSEPEIAFLNIGRVDNEVRSAWVRASSPCDEVRDDQFGNLYVHSPCQLAAFFREGRPLLFVGQRLGLTISQETSRAIVGAFRYIGKVDHNDVFCRGAGCEALHSEFAGVR